MYLILACVLFIGLFQACLILARRLSGFGILLSGPIAYGILVTWESVLLNALSCFSAVSFGYLLVTNIAFIAVVHYYDRCCSKKNTLDTSLKSIFCKYYLFFTGKRQPVILVLAPLFVILIFGALLYPPNTWDSMTYHMARVVQWMQRGSISYYPTNIDRQNLLAPGAEYLILIFQIISKSDLFANCVQLFAYFMIVSSTSHFVRMLGASRSVAPWAVVIVATLPMGRLILS